MSIPRRHHYLPRVHIRKFKTGNGYHLYLKNEKRFINPQSSANIFLEKYLNSTICEGTGEIDHKTIEEEFGQIWDSKFNHHYNFLMDWITETINNNKIDEKIIQDTFKFFFGYALVGKLRRIKSTEEYNKSAFDWFDGFECIKEFLSSDKVQEISKDQEIVKSVKEYFYNLMNRTENYIELAQKKLKFPAPAVTSLPFLVPPECSCDIFLSEKPAFLLPDCTSIVVKSNETIEYHGMKINKVDCIGFSVSPHVFLQLKNNEVREDKVTDIYEMREERIIQLNKKIFMAASAHVLFPNKSLFTELAFI